MTEIRFYHLTRSSLEDALPPMLEKVLERQQRAVVLTGSPERAEHLARHLWTYKDHGFLPHGTAEDGMAEDQPIWITSADENPNNAQVLMLTDRAASASIANYELVCEIFSDADPDAVTEARARWQNYKKQGLALAYWQQGEKGWEKTA